MLIALKLRDPLLSTASCEEEMNNNTLQHAVDGMFYYLDYAKKNG